MSKVTVTCLLTNWITNDVWQIFKLARRANPAQLKKYDQNNKQITKSDNVYEGNVEYFLFPYSKFTYHLNKWNNIVLSLTLYLLLPFFTVQSLLDESINKRSTIALIHQE